MNASLSLAALLLAASVALAEVPLSRCEDAGMSQTVPRRDFSGWTRLVTLFVEKLFHNLVFRFSGR